LVGDDASSRYNEGSPLMPLASRIAFQFDRRFQTKGLYLFAARAVRVTGESASHLNAVVTGGRLYQVQIRHDDGHLLVFCECPAFEEYGQCKHLWAAILEADRRGALTEALNAKYLKLEDDFSFHNGDDDALFEVPTKFALRQPPPPQIPEWQEHLTTIQREIELKKPLKTPWPREFEILYVIDPMASRASGAIVVELYSRTRKKNREWSTHKAFKVTPAQAGSLPDPVDAEVVTAMLGGLEANGYQYYSTGGSTTRKALPASLAVRLLPTISAVDSSGVGSRRALEVLCGPAPGRGRTVAH
jgi:hypothetical protein